MRSAIVVCLCACTGCLLVTELGSLNDGSDARVGDGGPDSESGAGPDSGDGGGNDAGDARASWCSTQKTTTFCEDFDTPALDPGWVVTTAPGGELLVLGDAGATSAPNALVARAPKGMGTGAFGASSITRQLAGTTAELHASCMIRVDALEGTLLTNATTLVIESAGNQYFAQTCLRRAATGTGVQVGLEEYVKGVTDRIEWGPTFEPGTWARIGLDIVRAGNSGTVRVTLDGISATEFPIAADKVPVAAPTARVQLGVIFSENANVSLAIDDCTIDVR